MSPIVFHTGLYAALTLCALGLLWRAAAWFRVCIGPDAHEAGFYRRVATAFRGAAAALFSRQVFRVLCAAFMDVLLQQRLFANDKLRWFGHLLIAVGFTLLLLMHALAAIVAARLFPGYQPTLDPYLFLRNLFGVMVLAGVALIFFRRWRRQAGLPRLRRSIEAMFVLLLAIVLASGFMLEAHKIASPRAFYRMAEQFIGSTDPGELGPLRAVWSSEYGVAFDDLNAQMAPQLLEKGREQHGNGCASCHAKPVSAFVSYPVARMLSPVTRLLDEWRADVWLLYLHLFACFVGLASLPFTLFFHLVTAPLSILVDGLARNRAFSSIARVSRRALALDACVRCGICDLRCSVAPLARYLGNPGLLPSHKLVATGALARGRLQQSGHTDAARRAADGAFFCTDCGRCTAACPIGLDLEDLWQAGRGDLAAAGFPAPATWAQALPALAWTGPLEPRPVQHALSGADAAIAPLAANRHSFSRCVQCQICTNVCPVVAGSMDANEGIDLTPQKVMNLLRLGLGELALGSRMVWSCAACYQCQENCPEGIRVTDIMCELRALAVRRLGSAGVRSVAS